MDFKKKFEKWLEDIKEPLIITDDMREESLTVVGKTFSAKVLVPTTRPETAKYLNGYIITTEGAVEFNKDGNLIFINGAGHANLSTGYDGADTLSEIQSAIVKSALGEIGDKEHEVRFKPSISSNPLD